MSGRGQSALLFSALVCEGAVCVMQEPSTARCLENGFQNGGVLRTLVKTGKEMLWKLSQGVRHNTEHINRCR